MSVNNSTLDRVKAMIANADALLIGAGAGMGVDSGLPDFRSYGGLWQQGASGFSFAELANPRQFQTKPRLAWGFYGYRHQLYSLRKPHAGYRILKAWADQCEGGGFVFTSNVDGHFLKAGFAEHTVFECHGSIHHLQCTRPCSPRIWPVSDLRLEVDTETLEARGELPHCPACGALARPNILMFGDAAWVSGRADLQYQHYQRWLARWAPTSMVAIELGAGLTIPTVRHECERFATRLIRINPVDTDVPSGGISLAGSALEMLEAIESR